MSGCLVKERKTNMIEKLTALVVLIVVVGVCGFVYTHQPHAAAPASAGDITLAAKMVKDAVSRLELLIKPVPPSLAGSPQRLFLTASDGLNPPIIAYARGADGAEALRLALQRLYARMGKGGFSLRWL